MSAKAEAKAAAALRELGATLKASATAPKLKTLQLFKDLGLEGGGTVHNARSTHATDAKVRYSTGTVQNSTGTGTGTVRVPAPPGVFERYTRYRTGTGTEQDGSETSRAANP